MLAGPTDATLVSRTRRDTRSAWGIALFWNLVSTPLLFVIPKEIGRKPVVAIAGLFPLVGLGLLVYAARLTARWRRFGEARFDMQRLASPGHTLMGRVRLPHVSTVPDGATATVRLTCLSRMIDQDGDVHERILWREETRAPLGSGEGATIAVSIPIPADALETTAAGRGAGIGWALTIDAKLPGVNLHELFDVHVRHSEGNDTTAAAMSRALGTQHTPVAESDLRQAGIAVDVVDGATVFRFAAARNPSFAAGLTAFAAVWAGALLLQYSLEFPIIFVAVTAVVELLLVVVTIDLWLRVTVLTFGAGRIHRGYSVLGVRSQRTWLHSEVKSVDTAITSQTSGATGTPYYDVRATLTSGRRVTLAPRVRDKRQVEWLAHRMRELVGLTRPRPA